MELHLFVPKHPPDPGDITMTLLRYIKLLYWSFKSWMAVLLNLMGLILMSLNCILLSVSLMGQIVLKQLVWAKVFHRSKENFVQYITHIMR